MWVTVQGSEKGVPIFDAGVVIPVYCITLLDLIVWVLCDYSWCVFLLDVDIGFMSFLPFFCKAL